MAQVLSSSPPRDGVPAQGLLVDWGGVLTAPLTDVLGGWLIGDGVAPDHFRDVLRRWQALGEDRGAGAAAHGGARGSPVHALERGELAEPEFERLLAGELAARGSPVSPEGLLDRVMAGLAELDEGMLALVSRVRAAGVPTALVSNSWGERYPERLFDGRFDAVVISGRVGMRKPEPGIFEHAAAALAVPLGRCVLVDDLVPNVDGARTVGAGAVHHTTLAATATALEGLFGVRLREPAPAARVSSPAAGRELPPTAE